MNEGSWNPVRGFLFFIFFSLLTYEEPYLVQNKTIIKAMQSNESRRIHSKSEISLDLITFFVSGLLIEPMFR